MDRLVDIDALRVADGNGVRTPARRPPPRPRQRERFLKGPIPWPWLERAGALRGKALHVAIRLWHEAGLARSNEVSLSLTSMDRMKISRFAASRGLTALEKAGLVCVVRRSGRKPMVTILATPTSTQPSLIDRVELGETDKVVVGSDERSSDEEDPLALGHSGE